MNKFFGGGLMGKGWSISGREGSGFSEMAIIILLHNFYLTY